MSIEDIGHRGGHSPVSIVTDLLGAAKRGEVKMLAIVWIHADGDIVSTVSAGDEIYKLAGGMSQTLYDLHATQAIESR